MNTRFIVALIITIMHVISAHRVEAQQPSTVPSSCPIWLPSGPGLHHWVATNRPFYSPVAIYYTTKAGGDGWIQNSGSVQSFSTLAQFQGYLASEGMRLVSSIKTNAKAGSSIRFNTTIYYVNLPYDLGLSINVTNVCTVEQVNSNSFIGLPARWEAGIVPVSGLERFTVEVSDPPYRYTWTPTSAVASPAGIYPQERTTHDLIVLNSWYALKSDSRVRYTVEAGGVTSSYTQLGSTISPPVVKMLPGARLQVSMSPGTETTVEATQDFVTWNKVATFYGTSTVFDIDRTAPHRFFRAYSN
ncbi:MAG: hypothetical protein AAB365_01105 [Patescibacteria group bacterium]